MSSTTRSIARHIARENMRKAGYTNVVKSGFFAKNWRKFVPHKTRRRRRKEVKE